MEKIELFLFDIFGNFLPGSIVAFLCFDFMTKILRLNLLDENIRKKMMIWVFIFISYIIGNGLNAISKRIFRFGSFGIRDVVSNKLKNGYLKTKFLPNEITYDLAKIYINSKNISNFISKYETKYIFYRNITLALCFSFIGSFFEKVVINNQAMEDFMIYGFIAIISILITFCQFKQYWYKSGNEIIDCILIIEKS